MDLDVFAVDEKRPCNHRVVTAIPKWILRFDTPWQSTMGVCSWGRRGRRRGEPSRSGPPKDEGEKREKKVRCLNSMRDGNN